MRFTPTSRNIAQFVGYLVLGLLLGMLVSSLASWLVGLS
jgi:hypothetical protein